MVCGGGPAGFPLYVDPVAYGATQKRLLEDVRPKRLHLGQPRSALQRLHGHSRYFKTFARQETLFQTTSVTHKQHLCAGATCGKAPGHGNARIEMATGPTSGDDHTQGGSLGHALPPSAMLSIVPMAMSDTSRFEPPRLMRGSGSPFVGMRPITTHRFMTICSDSRLKMPSPK